MGHVVNALSLEVLSSFAKREEEEKKTTTKTSPIVPRADSVECNVVKMDTR